VPRSSESIRNGKIVDPQKIIKALKENPHAKICGVVHAETSTGVREPLEEIGAYCKKNDTLFVVDAVTSLGAGEMKVDEWGIDVCYSCTQKGISVPPGLSPFTVSPRAMDVLRSRKTKVQSFYLDLLKLEKYWGEEGLSPYGSASCSMRSGRIEDYFEEGLEEISAPSNTWR
jgi:alanine-glyoxylate transaminase/serine-glyoxylate transaminase/serine-pyruvate transaminase